MAKEYIEREALIERINNASFLGVIQNSYLLKRGVIDLVKKQSTADVVEVIYCKDCRHRDPEDKKCDIFQGCGRGILPVKDTDFCSYGERKDTSNEI